MMVVMVVSGAVLSCKVMVMGDGDGDGGGDGRE